MIKESILKLLKIDGLIDNVTQFLETRLELFKLEVKEEVAGLLAKVVLILLLGVTFIFFLIMASIGLAYYLGSIVGMIGGFLIVAGSYLFIGAILVLFRKDINAMLEKLFIQIAQNKKE